MLDNIESNLEDANDYVEKAEKDLESAQEIHTATRKVNIHIYLIIL